MHAAEIKPSHKVQYTPLLNEFRKLVQTFDITIILLTSTLTVQMRRQMPGEAAPNFLPVVISEIAVPIIWIGALLVSNAWDRKSLDTGYSIFTNVLSTSWKAIFFAAGISYFLKSNVSRIWFGITQISIIFFLLASRTLLRLWFERAVAKRTQPRYLVICPESSYAETLSLMEPKFGTKVTYFRMDPPPASEDCDWQENLNNFLKKHQIDGLILGVQAVPNQILMRELTWLFNEKFSDLIIISKLAPMVPRLETNEHHTWMRVSEPKVVGAGFIAKRIGDFVFSALALILLSPVMLLISIAVATTSSGGVFYIDDRVGKDNVPFRFPKFRTMYSKSDEKRLEILGRPDENMRDRYKNDPRVTPVGRFLRRWSLDELPQFWCVLVGTMSIVGPRPILIEELPQVDSNRNFRFVAKPGLTGLWQVSGRKEVDWTERMMQDVLYIETWTPTRDLMLTLQTAQAILSGKGAY